MNKCIIILIFIIIPNIINNYLWEGMRMRSPWLPFLFPKNLFFESKQYTGLKTKDGKTVDTSNCIYLVQCVKDDDTGNNIDHELI